jgi:hypothetical protein
MFRRALACTSQKPPLSFPAANACLTAGAVPPQPALPRLLHTGCRNYVVLTDILGALRQSSQSINTFPPPLLEGFVSSHLHPDNAREIYLALLQPLHQPSINTHSHSQLSQPPTTNQQPTTNHHHYSSTNQPTTLNHNGRPYLRRVCHGFPEPASLPRATSHTPPSSGPLQIDDASTPRRHVCSLRLAIGPGIPQHRYRYMTTMRLSDHASLIHDHPLTPGAAAVHACIGKLLVVSAAPCASHPQPPTTSHDLLGSDSMLPVPASRYHAL